MSEPQRVRFVLCIRNDNCDDLMPRKIYRVLPDARAAEENYLRIIDESGDDYLYPDSYFVPLALPPAAENALLAAADHTTQPS